MGTGEPEINIALAEVLNSMRRRWTASAERLGAFIGSHRVPDVLVTEQGVAPVVAETEVLPALTVESDAISKLGAELSNGSVVAAVVAARLPIRLRDAAQEQLRADLRSATDLEYALFTSSSADAYNRFPSSGWLVGTVADLASLIYEAAIPEPHIDAAATELERGVSAAARSLSETIDAHPKVSPAVAAALRQQDNDQTRRMAMTIVANAFVFHESLAGSYDIQTVDELRNESGRLIKTAVLDEWRRILDVNYWPIFDIAGKIVTPLPQADAAIILEGLARTAGTLVVAGVTRSHDLSGRVFQRLVADRKFLATFHTRPQAATLLTSVALTTGGSWADPARVEAYRIADLACGTGTLLSAAYRRVRLLHEHAGGDAETITRE